MTERPTHDRPTRVLRIASWSLAALIVIGLAGAWFALKPGLRWGRQDAGIAANMPQDEFEQRVRTYLLEHPDVIAEAINRLEARQGEQEATAAQVVLKSRSDDVFRDPDSPVGGNPNGDVTLVEFFDYNCPYCRQMVPLLTEAEAADPQLRVVYKEFPILGPNSTSAAKAALAANRQGKYVAFHRALYQVRGPVDESKALEAAATVGLDLERLKADMRDPAIEAMLDKNLELARVLRITGTPGFVAGDRVLVGAADLTALQTLIRGSSAAQQDAK
jgi:protein-disulfide isomerase